MFNSVILYGFYLAQRNFKEKTARRKKGWKNSKFDNFLMKNPDDGPGFKFFLVVELTLLFSDMSY